MMFGFHETVYAKRLFESQIPKVIKALERIANALEEQNKLIKEKDTKQ